MISGPTRGPNIMMSFVIRRIRKNPKFCVADYHPVASCWLLARH